MNFSISLKGRPSASACFLYSVASAAKTFFGKGEFPGGEFVPPKFGEYGFEYKHHEPNRYGQADGGITNLTRTVAPDSGPMSQGLSYLYNRVKKQ